MIRIIKFQPPTWRRKQVLKVSLTSLSPSAKQVAELVETMANGNQRRFARLVGCAQPAISRILNGKQEPGRDLLERIAKVDGVDRESLIATWKAQSSSAACVHSQIPIVQGLLKGPPTENQELLTTTLVEVASRLSRQSVYAVRASQCWPVFEDESESMQAEDLVIIESSVEHYRHNIQMLDGNLAVIQGNSRNSSITMQRVHVKYDEAAGKRLLFVKEDEHSSELSQQGKSTGRQQRVITFRDEGPEQGAADLIIDPKNVVGVALELIRSL